MRGEKAGKYGTIVFQTNIEGHRRLTQPLMQRLLDALQEWIEEEFARIESRIKETP